MVMQSPVTFTPRWPEGTPVFVYKVVYAPRPGHRGMDLIVAPDEALARRIVTEERSGTVSRVEVVSGPHVGEKIMGALHDAAAWEFPQATDMYTRRGHAIGYYVPLALFALIPFGVAFYSWILAGAAALALYPFLWSAWTKRPGADGLPPQLSS